ncbi:hypothetical protein B0H66DRAFT_548055 [Apodospora peruviana]|uniref:Ribosomal protein bL31m N-terminal domain-containing protein n=1 Tax=Apodospora peruviana TaxID=516989 RepID=A0AAE0MAF9_9PEZI|nr:hypothetical protein B0H66DRAFT_548055 [Apodospora peruviana]
MGKLPTSVLQRPRAAAALLTSSTTTTSFTSTSSLSPRISPHCGSSQVRHATFVPRARRPYQFTQLVQLSDGSTFTARTTMPQGMYKSTKDSRNHQVWQPSDKSLKNVEVDEAGKLAAFRERFGRGWDLDQQPLEGEAPAAVGGGAEAATKGAGAQNQEQQKQAATPAEPSEDPFDSLTDLISQYHTADKSIKGGMTAKEAEKLLGKKKK